MNKVRSLKVCSLHEPVSLISFEGLVDLYKDNWMIGSWFLSKQDSWFGPRPRHLLRNGNLEPMTKLLVDGRIKLQTNRQAGRQAGCQTNIQPGRQTARHTDRQTDRKVDRQTDKKAGRQTEGQRGRQAARQKGRQADEQTDRQTDRQTKRKNNGWS